MARDPPSDLVYGGLKMTQKKSHKKEPQHLYSLIDTKTTADTPSDWLIKQLILIKVSFLITNKAWTEIVP